MPKKVLWNHPRISGLEVICISHVAFVLRGRDWEQDEKNSASAVTRVRTGELALVLKTQGKEDWSQAGGLGCWIQVEPEVYRRLPGGILLKFVRFAIPGSL